MIKFDKKISLDDFLKTKFNVDNFDKDYINDWNKRSFFAQMLDTGGEMHYTLEAFNNNEDEESLLKHITSLNDVCSLIYNNPNILDGEKESLKIAEGEFIAYILGNSNDKSCIKGFDQGNNDINYDLL